mmetsp:Transcript_18972/g.22172  ORF Transcript_18972/g.22172 Transcript_18972/m.22172 type:complete len:97 (-) Transcript_18972:291-581(-)
MTSGSEMTKRMFLPFLQVTLTTSGRSHFGSSCYYVPRMSVQYSSSTYPCYVIGDTRVCPDNNDILITLRLTIGSFFFFLTMMLQRLPWRPYRSNAL